jgi:acylphosphatase
MTRANLTAWGVVQGVGFRWTVSDTAQSLGLSGLVRNLRDGSVQIFLDGSREKILEFIKVIKVHKGVLDGLHPRVSEVHVVFEDDVEFQEPWRSYSGFEIDSSH